MPELTDAQAEWINQQIAKEKEEEEGDEDDDDSDDDDDSEDSEGSEDDEDGDDSEEANEEEVAKQKEVIERLQGRRDTLLLREAQLRAVLQGNGIDADAEIKHVSGLKVEKGKVSGKAAYRPDPKNRRKRPKAGSNNQEKEKLPGNRSF